MTTEPHDRSCDATHPGAGGRHDSQGDGTSVPAQDIEHGREDAAYVLGALEPAERQRYERHLQGCARCRAAVQDLAGVTGLLAHAGARGTAALQGEVSAPPPSGLLPGLLARVGEQRRRRRRQGVLLAAAALLAVMAGVGATVAVTRPDPAADVRMVQLSAVSGAPLTAEVALTSRPWGTGVRVTCRYTDSGADPTVPYDLIVVGPDGLPREVGEWKGLPDAVATVDGATALSTDDIAAIEVRLADGRTVLRGVPG